MNEEEQDTGRSRTIIAAVTLVLLSMVIMVGYGYYVRSSRQTLSPSESVDAAASPEAEVDVAVAVETVSRTPLTDPADPSLITYAVRFRVKSAEAQKEVIIEEEIESGQEYVEDSASPHVAKYDASTRRLQWHLKGVPAGYEGDLTYKVTKQ